MPCKFTFNLEFELKMLDTEKLCMHTVQKKANAAKHEYFKFSLDTSKYNSARIINFSSIFIRNIAKK